MKVFLAIFGILAAVAAFQAGDAGIWFPAIMLGLTSLFCAGAFVLEFTENISFD